MTDLKQLLDEAAGPEAGAADGTADLERGRRALKRRRLTGTAAGALATAAVVGVAWAVLPLSTTSSAPATQQTTKPAPTKAAATPSGARPGDHDKRKPPVIPAKAVPLVTNAHAFAGVTFTCDLIPQGWAVKRYGTQLALYDPALTNPNQYHDATYTLSLWAEDMVDYGAGLTPAKYGDPWSKLPKVRAGKQLVVSSAVPGSPYGRQQVFLRQGKTKHLIAVSNNAYNLAWDANTLLRFAGSCHSK